MVTTHPIDTRPGSPNCIAPSKRPLTNMCPVIVTRNNGEGWFAIGASGGRKIMPAVTQVCSFLIDHGMNVQAALEASEAKNKDSQVQIADLGSRLNAALASRVQELTKFRSEFFGRLRDILGNQPGIRIVGDRFVFQSEVLFAAGSAVWFGGETLRPMVLVGGGLILLAALMATQDEA